MSKTTSSAGSTKGGKGSGGVKYPPHQDHKPMPAPAATSKVTSTSRSPRIMTGQPAKSGNGY